LELSNS